MSEMRFDPTRGEWTSFASHRQDRSFLPPEDHCPLCPTKPGRAATEISRGSFDVVVFENRFSAFLSHPPVPQTVSMPPFSVRPAAGACEVVVYSDDHHLPMADMAPARIANIVEVWADRYTELSGRPEIEYVFIFENKGVEVGVTLHHPHGQIYGYPLIPPAARLQLEAAGAHLAGGGGCIFCEQLEYELSDGRRVVAENEDFVAFVPFAARFPYEIHIVSRRHAASIAVLSAAEKWLLASLFKQVLWAYDNLFGFSMPYIMGMHQAPSDGGDWTDVSHFHVEFYPPYRTAEKLKYLAGSELGAGQFLNDTLPEQTASALRESLQRL